MADRKLRVFLCHASQDKPIVRELYQKLLAEGWIDPWLDKEKLLPGQNWREEIPKAIQNSDLIIVCLSRNSITKEGYVQKEIRFALDRAEEKPQGTIFVIPIRLEDCNVPDRLSGWQWVDLFDESGYEKLLQASEIRAAQLRISISSSVLRQFSDIHFVKIPSGSFLLGSHETNEYAYTDECPQQTFEIGYDFFISRYEIKNEQFQAFARDTGLTTEKNERIWQKYPEHPVVKVSWYEAIRFCKWVNDKLSGRLRFNWACRLPSEAEWEKAARGEDGREWPWGDRFEPLCCNHQKNEKRPTPVDAYSPQGDSVYDVADMVGNVSEWTQSLYKSYPYNQYDGRENLKTPGDRVLRGGSFDKPIRNVRAACRSRLNPRFRLPSVGFRILIGPPIP